MRISTSEFLLGSLPEMLAQQSTINELNQEIASGQTMPSATSDPAGAGLALQTAGQIRHLTYDSSNAEAGNQTIQATLGALEQVGTVIDQLRQVALSGADGGASANQRQALVVQAQNALQQLIQLANTQGANGSYLFAGSKTAAAPFTTGSDGSVAFGGDGATNAVEIAPGIAVPVTASGQQIFDTLPAGRNGVAITADAANGGGATVLVGCVTSLSQVAAERLAGTQYQLSFTSVGLDGSLGHTIASGTGSPGTNGFAATSGTIASGSVAAGAGLQFAGIDVAIDGTPAAGDSFVVQPGAQASLFQTVQDLIAALAPSQPGQSMSAAALQQVQNVIANLAGAQTSVLSAEAALGAGLSEIKAVQGQDQNQSTTAQVQLTGLQSANLPQVIANYSASITALQSAELAFARIQNLTLFSVIHS